MSLSASRCESIDSLGSVASTTADAAPHRDESAQLRQFGEKMVLRVNRMKKQLMDKTVAYLAEQNCRKAAEARLDTELRKLYKLQAHNKELSFCNTRLQQQLKASKNEVEKLTVENKYLRSTLKVSTADEPTVAPQQPQDSLEQQAEQLKAKLQALVECLKEQLSLRDTKQQQPHDNDPVQQLPPPQALPEVLIRQEAAARGPGLEQPLPEHVRESMHKLIESSAEVFDIVASVASQTGRRPPPFASKDGEPGPSTPEHSDADCTSSRVRHSLSPHSRDSSRSSMDTVLTHPLSPTQSSDFCIDTELSLALPAGNALRRTISLLSTCSLEQFSDTSVTSSPIANHQGAKEENWLERLSAAQELLGCERDPAPHLSTGAPIMERLHLKKPATPLARRNGSEWTEPFNPEGSASICALPQPASIPTPGDSDSAGTPASPMKELKKTRSGGIRALCQRSLSQAFGQAKLDA